MSRRNGLNDRVVQEVKKRPLENLIRPKEELDQENKERYMSYKTPTRKTFLMDPMSIEALRIFTFKNRKKLSEALVDMLLQYIPREDWEEARNNIIDFEKTEPGYLDDLEVLDIDSIYYNNK